MINECNIPGCFSRRGHEFYHPGQGEGCTDAGRSPEPERWEPLSVRDPAREARLNAFERDLIPATWPRGSDRRSRTQTPVLPIGATERAASVCAMYLRRIGARCRRGASQTFAGWRVCEACASALNEAGFEG